MTVRQPTRKTLSEKMFGSFLAHQSLFFDDLPASAKSELAQIEYRYAELRITGEEGGLFYFQFKDQRLHLLPQKPAIPYEQVDKLLLDGDDLNYPDGFEVLIAVVYGDLPPREVVSHNYFGVNSDRVIVDKEVFMRAFEKFIQHMRRVLKRE